MFLRNAPTISAIHSFGDYHRVFSICLAIGLMAAAVLPLRLVEDRAPVAAVYHTILNISVTCWCFGLFMGIAKVLSFTRVNCSDLECRWVELFSKGSDR